VTSKVFERTAVDSARALNGETWSLTLKETIPKMDYVRFLDEKQKVDSADGFEPIWMPDELFDFQKHIVDWVIRTGRAAAFEDCGLGKTIQQLVHAENIVRHTNKPVLLATPLAVGPQTLAEADKFGIEASRSRDGLVSDGSRVYITNYEQLHKFDAAQFSGFIGDESSGIKNFRSQRKKIVTEFVRKMKYRSLWTATAAPNDVWELGTSSEALGYLGFRDMITTFFKQDLQSSSGLGWGRSKYRFRGHAEHPFWRWVCSWARAIRKPSDIGYSDERFELPPLHEHEHVVDTKKAREGMLFSLAARNLHEQRQERRNSIRERCDKAVSLAESHDGATVLWCELNDEGDQLARSLPDSVQVKGSMSDESKEEKLLAFSRGEIKQLITKPKVGCWGLNWQHCHNVISFPSHSYEQYYQAVRRCWRFGQTNPVNVHIVINEGELNVLKNIRRKASQADEMFTNLVGHMNDALSIDAKEAYDVTATIPLWV